LLHRLDPRTKILGTTLLIVLLFAVNGFIGYGLVALAIAGVIHLAKLPWRYVIRGLRPLLVHIASDCRLERFSSRKGK